MKRAPSEWFAMTLLGILGTVIWGGAAIVAVQLLMN